jgi:Helix-turn-helix domain
MPKAKVNPKKWYTPKEAAPFLRVGAESVKKHCRDKKLRGKQVGAKKEWMIPGTAIIKKRKEWKLDGIER